MGLFEESLETFYIIDKTTQLDGYGGVTTVYQRGAKVDASATEKNTTEAQIAQALSEKRTYRVLTRKSVVFRYNDIIYRASDGKTFRIISDADDKKTPASANLNMRACDAELVELASEIVIPTNISSNNGETAK